MLPTGPATTEQELAKQCLTEVYHLVVTCNSAGELYRRHVCAERSLALLMPEGANDVGFAMTSSFTCMTLATWLTMRSSTADDRLAGRLAAATEGILTAQSSAAGALTQRGYERVVYLGSGPLTGLARESALNLLELTAGRVIAYSNSALGFRHCPNL